MSTLELIESLAADGADKLAHQKAAQEEAYRQHEAEEQAGRDVLWKPIVDKVKAVIPAALHEYLRWPDHEKPEFWSGTYDTYRSRLLLVQLPDASPIEVYAHKPTITFDVPEPRLKDDEDGDWFVHHDLNYHTGNWQTGAYTDFSIAVHKAVQHGKQLAKLQADADNRNAEPRHVDVSLEQRRDPGKELADALVGFLNEYGYSMGIAGY